VYGDRIGSCDECSADIGRYDSAFYRTLDNAVSYGGCSHIAKDDEEAAEMNAFSDRVREFVVEERAAGRPTALCPKCGIGKGLEVFGLNQGWRYFTDG